MNRKKTLTGIIAFSVMVILFFASGSVFAAENSLTIKGSDTMVHLVSALAENYMKLKPDVSVSVTGGGSGTGISALINKTTDIAASSRDMKSQEFAQAKEKGVNPKAITVARDGIAIIVNPYNPVKDLSMEQIKKIYTGVYTNWNQLGGPNKKITVLSRESSSGTYVFFQEHVLNKEDYAASARLMPSTSSIVQSVSSDKGTIGYVGLGYATEAKTKVKIVKVKKSVQSVGIIPSERTVKSGVYPIARALYFYVDNPPSLKVKAFLNFTLSAKGQQIVKEADYITVK